MKTVIGVSKTILIIMIKNPIFELDVGTIYSNTDERFRIFSEKKSMYTRVSLKAPLYLIKRFKIS